MSKKKQGDQGIPDSSDLENQQFAEEQSPQQSGDDNNQITAENDQQAAESDLEAADRVNEEIKPVDNQDSQIEANDNMTDTAPSAPAPVAKSGGKGMAGTAMLMSALALGGSGYNWYQANLVGAKPVASSQSAIVDAVDYEPQISELQAQIQSLTSTQQNLTDQLSVFEQQAQQQPAVAEAAEQTSAPANTLASDSDVDSQVEEIAQETVAAVEETAEQTQVAEQLSQSEAEPEENKLEQEIVEATEQAEQVVDEVEQQIGELETPVVDSETVATEAEEDELQVTDSEPAAVAATEVNAAAEVNEDISATAKAQIDAVLAQATKRLALSEVGQLLSLGQQRLNLAGDVNGAQTALSIADQRLVEIAAPEFESLQQSIATDINSLASLEVVDKAGLTEQIGSLAGQIDDLAFKPLETLLPDDQSQSSDADVGQSEPAASAAGEDVSLENAGNLLKNWGAKIGDTLGEVGSGIAGDLKNMVRIQKTGPVSDIVLAPEQQYFIRENIKLTLSSAQRAVLQGSNAVFQQNISQVQSLLGEFFDAQDSGVQQLNSDLAALGQVNLEPKLPDISDSAQILAKLLQQSTAN